MCKKLLITLGAALALGCAPGGQANAPSDDVASSDAGLELVIRNLGGTRAVFAQWDGGRGRYIGDIGADQVTFTIPIGGQVFTLEHGSAGRRTGPRPTRRPARVDDSERPLYILPAPSSQIDVGERIHPPRQHVVLARGEGRR